MIKLLIVDDHPMYRAGLVAALGPLDDIDIVAEAADGETAITLSDELRPDVILMDLTMPGIGGVAATRAISERYPETAVLVLTMSEATDSVWAAMRAGARGYLVKGSAKADITHAIDVARRGGMVFGPAIADQMQRFFQNAADKPRPFPELTDRETEILKLIAAGDNNSEIAALLYVSNKTVRNHISNIFTKLQVHNRAEARQRARDAGINDGSVR